MGTTTDTATSACAMAGSRCAVPSSAMRVIPRSSKLGMKHGASVDSYATPFWADLFPMWT